MGTQLDLTTASRESLVALVAELQATITEHVFIARVCAGCRRRHVPKVALQGTVMGQQRLGVNLVSLIVTLREEGWLPFLTIQWYLQTSNDYEKGVFNGELGRVSTIDMDKGVLEVTYDEAEVAYDFL